MSKREDPVSYELHYSTEGPYAMNLIYGHSGGAWLDLIETQMLMSDTLSQQREERL